MFQTLRRTRHLVASAENIAAVRALLAEKGERRVLDYFSISSPTLSRILAGQPVSRVTARHVEIRLQQAHRSDVHF